MAERLGKSVLCSGMSGFRVPAYDVDTARIGVVHLGPGAFHRAHQAAYFDALLALDPNWAISGVSLRSRELHDALSDQHGLYCLALLGDTPEYRVIGALRETLVASERQHDLMTRLSAPETKLVTLTVTEFGYCLGPDGHLDTALPVIQHDIKNPQVPISVPGVLVEALRRRRSMGHKPFTVLSCDNLPENGRQLKTAVVEMALKTNWDIANWITHEVPFPCSMVDSITPATTDALRNQVREATGFADAWPVQREPFTQWVIEPSFIEKPALDEVGVIYSDQVEGYERAKLRLLNGSHSAAAYLGVLFGMETVYEAATDSALAGFLETMMRQEILPGLMLPKGFDGDAYISSLFERYRNSAIRHELAQIVWDGSQKLPIRLLPTIAENLQCGRPCIRLVGAVAAWLHFIRCRARAGQAFKDPLYKPLSQLARSTLMGDTADTAAFVRGSGIFPASLQDSVKFLHLLAVQFDSLSVEADHWEVRLGKLARAA